MLDRSNPLPLYFQLRTRLLDQIEGGAWKPGDAIPTERELIDRYRVSRVTVRQAINSLVGDGLLYRQRGRGTFVRRSSIQQELSTLTGFSEEMVARGMEPGARVISAEMAEADTGVARKLQLAPGQRVFRLTRVRLADGEPIALDLNQFPAEVGERLLKEDLEGALYSILEQEIGIEIDWADQAIQATQADEFVASHLGVKKGMPTLLVERLVYSTDGRPLEHCRSFYRADRYAYRIRLKRKTKPLSRPPVSLQ